MSCLAPCPACNRHVANDETACPFCSAVLSDSFRCQPRPKSRGRMSRAAILAASAALIGAESCSTGAPAYGAPAPDATTDTGTMDGGPVALYGAVPAPLEQSPPDQTTKPNTDKKTDKT